VLLAGYMPLNHGDTPSRGGNMTEFLGVGGPLGMARSSAWIAAAGLMAAGTLPARAQTSATVTEAPATSTAAPSASAAEAPQAGLWISGIHLSAQIDAGFMGNPSRPADA
jgi:hypothetical protein